MIAILLVSLHAATVVLAVASVAVIGPGLIALQGATLFNVPGATPVENAYIAALIWPYSWLRVMWPQWLLMLFNLAMPATFLLIPITLSSAKVRLVHLVRGVCYAAVPGVATIPVLHTIDVLSILVIRPTFNPKWLLPAIDVGWTMCMFVLIVWSVRWWFVFVKRYLKLPTPRRVYAVMCLVALLATIDLSTWLPFG